MTALHRDLPDSELHEPKGVASASVDEVYVANGSGSGTWASPPSTAPAAHSGTHENGGADEVNVGGLSGVLADAQTPTSHASTHASAGSDPVTPSAIGAVPTSEKGADSGVAELDSDGYVPSGQLKIGPFGEEVDSSTSSATSSTTSTTLQQKLRASLTIGEAGTYLVTWHYQIYHSNNTLTEATVTQVEVDDTTVIGENLWSYTPHQGYSGVYPVTFTAGAHTVDIDYSALGGGTAYIEDATIVVFRLE